MREPSGRHWAGVASIAASLLINSAVFFSVDHAVTKGSAHRLFSPAREAKKEIVQFEFVEAPPVPAPEKPKNAKKNAARDSRASDLTQGQKKGSAPKAVQGRSDQLAQRPAKNPPRPPQAAQKPSSEEVSAKSSVTGARPVREKAPQKPPESADAWMPAQGKILTQEMARARSKGARFYGVTSFEATGSGMGVYMERLKEKIWKEWFPYIAFKFPRDFRGADAVIGFTIDAKGVVHSAKVVESKGTPIFAAFCVEAVERARNFGPLPKEILALTGKDELEISFGFHYG